MLLIYSPQETVHTVHELASLCECKQSLQRLSSQAYSCAAFKNFKVSSEVNKILLCLNQGWKAFVYSEPPNPLNQSSPSWRVEQYKSLPPGDFLCSTILGSTRLWSLSVFNSDSFSECISSLLKVGKKGNFFFLQSEIQFQPLAYIEKSSGGWIFYKPAWCLFLCNTGSFTCASFPSGNCIHKSLRGTIKVFNLCHFK